MDLISLAMVFATVVGTALAFVTVRRFGRDRSAATQAWIDNELGWRLR